MRSSLNVKSVGPSLMSAFASLRLYESCRRLPMTYPICLGIQDSCLDTMIAKSAPTACRKSADVLCIQRRPRSVSSAASSATGFAMHKRALQFLFGFILLSLTTYNLWVSTQQSVLDWGGLT